MGGGVLTSGGPGDVTLRNSILYGNTAALGPNASAALTSLGYNIADARNQKWNHGRYQDGHDDGEYFLGYAESFTPNAWGLYNMLGNAADLKNNQWLRLNQIWVVFFIFVGFVNIYVAYSYPEPFWVKFKLFGMLGITVAFVIIQSIWLTLVAQKNEAASGDSEA